MRRQFKDLGKDYRDNAFMNEVFASQISTNLF